MSDDTLLVYGAYGYTGRLVSERLVGVDGRDVAAVYDANASDDRDAGGAGRGDPTPVLAGRDAAAVTAVGDELDCPARAFPLDDPAAVAGHLVDAGVDAVLNCAGPFERTADPLVEACLSAGVDYLDVTGEIPVFVRQHRRDADARDAEVTLLPGVGFDVVPTDCAAARLVERLPDATHLDLGFEAHGGLSPGTARTAVEGLADGGGEGGAVRLDGVIRAEPVAARTRTVDFGTGPREAATIPWGDVATAHWTTGVDNVAVYVPMAPRARRALRAAARLGPLVGAAPVRRLLSAAIDLLVDGPDAETRASGRSFVWGEARVGADGSGGTATVRLEAPETYALTVDTAVAAARRVLAGDVEPGFATPAGAFGSEFVIEATDATWTTDE